MNVRRNEFEHYDRTGIGFDGRLNLTRERYEQLDGFTKKQTIAMRIGRACHPVLIDKLHRKSEEANRRLLACCEANIHMAEGADAYRALPDIDRALEERRRPRDALQL